MALINEEKKFIFFHLYKCAGNSMREILDSSQCYEYQGGHSLPRDVRDSIGKYKYDEYFKFTVVRNPFDWLLSTYNYIQAYKSHDNHNVIINMDLAQFIQYYVDVMMLNKGVPAGSNKCVTMFDFISDANGKVIVDYIGKLEDIEASMKDILSNINIPYRPIPFVNVNPIRVSDYRICYNEESRSLVEKYFSKDLNYFNYEF